jgi:hypothetical protein
MTATGELKKDLLKATKLQANALDIAGARQFFLWRHYVVWMREGRFGRFYLIKPESDTETCHVI